MIVADSNSKDIGPLVKSWAAPSEVLNRKFVLSKKVKKSDGLVLDENKINTFFGVTVDSVNLLIETSVMLQAIDVPKIYGLPNVENWFRGVANIRGNFVPIFDLVAYLDLTESEMSNKKLVVIGEGKETVGILSEHYPGHYSFDNKSELSQLPDLPESLEKCVESAYSKDNDIWLKVDKERFLTDMARSANRN